MICPELFNLCESLRPLLYASASADDLLPRVRLDGEQYADADKHLAALLSIKRRYGLAGITVRFNGAATDAQDFLARIETGEPIRTWQVLVSKTSIVDHLMPEGHQTTLWFLSEAGFDQWAKGLDPFGTSSEELRKGRKSRILVHGLNYAFGGPSLAVANIEGANIPDDWPDCYDGPGDNEIKQQVHLLASHSTSLDPSPFLLDWGDVNSESAQVFRMLSAQSLCASISQEFYGHDRVVLKGSRRLELPLVKATDSAPSAKQLASMWTAVQWVYAERAEVRAALIADRLTLDVNDGQSLVDGTARYIEDALAQSKDQYRFVIKERKDAYAKELRELLKDAQQQAVLLSEKIRSILNGLLRDVLAALLLISLGLFSRIGRTQEVLASKEADLLFKALSAYLMISLALQLLIHLRDVHLSKDELKYWTITARNQLGINEIDRYLNDPIKIRKRSFIWLLSILSAVYVGIAVIAWNFQHMARLFGILL